MIAVIDVAASSYFFATGPAVVGWTLIVLTVLLLPAYPLNVWAVRRRRLLEFSPIGGRTGAAGVYCGAGEFDHSCMYTCRAQVTLTVNHSNRATSDLREELTRKVFRADPLDVPDWATMSMTGPKESWGPRGEIHFGYEATVRVRSIDERVGQR